MSESCETAADRLGSDSVMVLPRAERIRQIQDALSRATQQGAAAERERRISLLSMLRDSACRYEREELPRPCVCPIGEVVKVIRTSRRDEMPDETTAAPPRHIFGVSNPHGVASAVSELARGPVISTWEKRVYGLIARWICEQDLAEEGKKEPHHD